MEIKEALKIVSAVKSLPHTREGLVYAGERYNFLLRKENHVTIDNNGFLKYVTFHKTHYYLSQIANELGKPVSAIELLIIKELKINGEKKYGKIYFTKKQKNKIIEYFQNRKSNK